MMAPSPPGSAASSPTVSTGGRAGRGQRVEGHAAIGPGRWHGLLHRDAVRPLNDPRLLPPWTGSRLRATHRLLRRSSRPLGSVLQDFLDAVAAGQATIPLWPGSP